MMSKRCSSHLSIFTLSFIFGLSLFVQAFLQKKIYFSVSNKATWSEAHSYCMEHYTDLATFQTKNELDTLESLLGLDTVYWIGLQKVNNVWIWSDGQEVTFTQWSREEPKKNGNDDCAVMRGGSWYDASCNVNVAFLCYEVEPILVNENKTWEEALEHCRALDSDPNSSYVYDLLHLNYKGFNSSVRTTILDAQTPEVWIGLRFLEGGWLWVTGNSLHDQLPACPAAGQNCGTMSKKGEVQLSNCSKKKNFICAKN